MMEINEKKKKEQDEREEDEERAEQGSGMSILMLPWLAHGHLSPFLELAKRLSRNNNILMIHLVSTPVNLSSLSSQINHKAFPSINLTPLHLPSLPSLPPHLHTTKHLPSHLMPTLKTAFDLSSPAFSSLLRDLRPDLLIYDFLQPWAPRAAQHLGIPSILFLTTSAACTSFCCHYLLKNHTPFPYVQISLQENDAGYVEMLNKMANSMPDMDRLLECIELSSSFVAIKTFRELEGKYIEYLSELIDKEVVPMGPLVPDTLDEDHKSNRKVIEWLNQKERNSVLFVSFGSEYFMKREEMEEIACGLEMSGVSFIWVVRFPEQGEKEEERLQGANKMPFGFLERIGEDLGLVLEGWAPQREILTHTSTGGFLTHCGWSSVMEGMQFGVPMVALPMQLDQPLNARLVSEAGVGVEIKRELGGGNDAGFRMFKREEVAEGIRDVMVNEKGREVRKKVKAMAELMGFKGNKETSFLVEKIALLCTGGKQREVQDLNLLS